MKGLDPGLSIPIQGPFSQCKLLRCLGQPPGIEDPQHEINNQLQDDHAAAIQHYVPRRARSLGQERLVELIRAGYKTCAHQREQRILNEPKTRHSQPPRAQPQQAKRSIAEKVTCLSEVMVDEIPPAIVDRAK